MWMYSRDGGGTRTPRAACPWMAFMQRTEAARARLGGACSAYMQIPVTTDGRHLGTGANQM
ncbi:hypothetical protein GCM10027066_16240 [Dyella jejuensis]